MSRILLKIMYGSRLYGTHTEKSDTDYKIIYIPEIRELILGDRIKNVSSSTGGDSKNHPDDIDCEWIPLQKFFKAYQTGQAYAIEIVMAVRSLWRPDQSSEARIVEIDPAFESICGELADTFRPNDLGGMIGFALKQHDNYTKTAKHRNFLLDLKGMLFDARASLKTLGDFVDVFGEDLKVVAFENQCKIQLELTGSHGGVNYKWIEFFGRKYDYKISIDEMIRLVAEKLATYGSRVEKVYEPKSLHHAARVVDQIILLHEQGYFSYPLPSTGVLVDIKTEVIGEDAAKKYLDERVEFMRKIEHNSFMESRTLLDEEMIYKFLLEFYKTDMVSVLYKGV